MKSRKGNTGIQTAFAIATFGAILAVIWAFTGVILQGTRDQVAVDTSPGFVLVDESLNMTQTTANFAPTIGIVIGGIILMTVGILVLVFVVKQITSATGGGKGGGRGGYRGRFGG